MSKGFTMIEMVMYVAALVLLVSTVASLLVWMVRANTQVQTRNELVGAVEHALSQITSEIREAQSVYTPTTTTSQLSLQTRKNLPAGEPFTYIDIFLCGTRICVKREFQNPFALTSERIQVSNLEFEEVQTGGDSSVRIVLEASYNDASQQMQATVSLRSSQ